jgi:hypothetical protein
MTSLPGVGDAEARVRAILVAQGGTPGAMPPPARLGEAVVAVEDENFYSNVAIDILDGAGRAALAILQRGGDPGGSASSWRRTSTRTGAALAAPSTRSAWPSSSRCITRKHGYSTCT